MIFSKELKIDSNDYADIIYYIKSAGEVAKQERGVIDNACVIAYTIEYENGYEANIIVNSGKGINVGMISAFLIDASGQIVCISHLRVADNSKFDLPFTIQLRDGESDNVYVVNMVSI